MALDGGLTRRSCITGVGQLVASGYVKIIRKGGKIGGRTLANDYLPCFELVKNKISTFLVVGGRRKLIINIK